MTMQSILNILYNFNFNLWYNDKDSIDEIASNILNAILKWGD